MGNILLLYPTFSQGGSILKLYNIEKSVPRCNNAALFFPLRGTTFLKLYNSAKIYASQTHEVAILIQLLYMNN